jgi:CubicO group peptidase (beta-lactamase class C family)
MNYLLLFLLPIFFACSSIESPKPRVTQELYFPPVGSTEWETTSLPTLGWNANEVPKLDAFVVSSDTRALMILKDGKIVYEKYDGQTAQLQPFISSNYWYWASAGKTVTAFLIGQAQSQGLLDIDDQSNDYLGNGWKAYHRSKRVQSP